MPAHALAFVEWDTFRGHSMGRRPERSFYYATGQKHLIKRVGKGGTLWIITRKKNSNKYSLAYKLVNCYEEAYPPEYVKIKFGDQCVVSRDWNRCVHYPGNDVTDHLRRLEFKTGMPMRKCKNMGSKILYIPELKAQDVKILEAFELNLLSERVIFISYSSKDKRIIAKLVKELNLRNVKVFWDVEGILASDNWRRIIEIYARGCDVIVVLVSKNSAESKWVRREVSWALEEYNKNGCVQRIFPLLLPDNAWRKFKELHNFQYMKYPLRPGSAVFEEITRILRALPRTARTGWKENKF